MLPASPGVPQEVVAEGILPVHPEDPARRRDFGRNGSYLVLRQLEQDVEGFEKFVRANADADPDEFAARLVGRKKSGEPLVEAQGENDFGYYAEDRHGFRCPIGSHIRRVNPRDAFADPSMGISPEEAQRIVNRHRLIRRGRLYGECGPNARGKRGLLFLCFNANLQRQFEFVQQHWINGSKFGGLDDEVDPIAGAQPGAGGRMTIQKRPRSRCVDGMPRFVKVRGGAYFFLPGLKALEFLAALEPARWPAPAAPDFPAPRFRPSRLYPAADLQTLANQVRRVPDLCRLTSEQRKITFAMGDGSGDSLRGAFHEPLRRVRDRPLVVLIHGLPGSEESEAVLHSAAHFLRRGHPVLRLNQRGAGPSRKETTQIYHAGRSEDLRVVIEKLRADFSDTGIVLLAYSLGANVMLKLLGESGPLDPVRAAVSVSAPIDLRATATHLRGLPWCRRWLYVRVLLHQTKRCALDLRGLDDGQRKAIASARSFYEFDERFLAPFNGFASANDYYDCSSALPRLGSIRVPTLLIHAEDDPMVPFAPYRAVNWAANGALYPLLRASGGHAGFHQRGSPVAWHDRCAAAFFDR
jgi:Dyp-type peroxidase family